MDKDAVAEISFPVNEPDGLVKGMKAKVAVAKVLRRGWKKSSVLSTTTGTVMNFVFEVPNVPAKTA